MRAAALTLMAGVVERRFHASQADLAGSVQPCACGQSARFKGHFPKTFRTALGPITLQRAYSHCAACEAGSYPRGCALQWEGSSLSSGLTRLLGTTAAQVSFAASSGLLDEVAGRQVPPKQVERSAQALGAAIAAEERTVIEPEPLRAPTVYPGMDGSGVPTRSAETVGRPGKLADGSAKARGQSGDRLDSRDPHARGPPPTRRGLGAPWIWKLAAIECPERSRSWLCGMPKRSSGTSAMRSNLSLSLFLRFGLIFETANA